ncbi:MAG: COQ9 family protein [Sphingomonadales bacterium]|nr:COQ9 family protein [Sphingomonadales bacterium]
MTNNKSKSKPEAEKEDKTPDEMAGEILDAVMTHVPFDGWSEDSIKKAADDVGLSRAYIKLAFPEGAADMVDAYLKRIDTEMLKELHKLPVDEIRIRDRISTAVKLRMEINQKNREVVSRTVAFLAMPQNTPLSVRSLWRTADMMWRWAGDKATDYNHYTKRVILSGVYSTTLLYWLNDDSEGYADTWGYLDRRIENVMQFEKVKSKGLKFLDNIPGLADIFGPKSHKQKDTDKTDKADKS